MNKKSSKKNGKSVKKSSKKTSSKKTASKNQSKKLFEVRLISGKSNSDYKVYVIATNVHNVLKKIKKHFGEQHEITSLIQDEGRVIL